MEFRFGPCTPNARPVYAAVVRVAAHEVVLIDCEDVDTAVCVAAHVVELWQRGWSPERVTSTLDANQ